MIIRENNVDLPRGSLCSYVFTVFLIFRGLPFCQVVTVANEGELSGTKQDIFVGDSERASEQTGESGAAGGPSNYAKRSYAPNLWRVRPEEKMRLNDQ